MEKVKRIKTYFMPSDKCCRSCGTQTYEWDDGVGFCPKVNGYFDPFKTCCDKWTPSLKTGGTNLIPTKARSLNESLGCELFKKEQKI